MHFSFKANCRVRCYFKTEMHPQIEMGGKTLGAYLRLTSVKNNTPMVHFCAWGVNLVCLLGTYLVLKTLAEHLC
jgi:hypothetical protein